MKTRIPGKIYAICNVSDNHLYCCDIKEKNYVRRYHLTTNDKLLFLYDLWDYDEKVFIYYWNNKYVYLPGECWFDDETIKEVK